MTRERQMEILMKDGCTEQDAEKHLKNGCTIFTDFEENFNQYMKDWDIDEDDLPVYKNMLKHKIPASDWGIVEDNGKTYYIMYVL